MNTYFSRILPVDFRASEESTIIPWFPNLMYRKKVNYSWQTAEGKTPQLLLGLVSFGVESRQGFFSCLNELHFSCHITCIGSSYSKGPCMNQHVCRVLQLKEFEVKVDLGTTKGVLEPWWTVQYVNYAYANHMKYTSYFFWNHPNRCFTILPSQLVNRAFSPLYQLDIKKCTSSHTISWDAKSLPSDSHHHNDSYFFF